MLLEQNLPRNVIDAHVANEQTFRMYVYARLYLL